MEQKDIFTIFISSAALLLAIISLFISIVQKNKESKRTIRKNLTDTLENVTKINIEFAKLQNDKSQYNNEGVIDLRRIYNSQRRILIAHADYLAEHYDDIATDIDCNLLAGAFNAIGDYNKADSYWQKTIMKSESNSIKHMNLRGYARFLFFQGKFQMGRSIYEEALKIELSDSDETRRLITDTYIMWASVEKEFDNLTEKNRIIELARSYCRRIGHSKMKNEMMERIEKLQVND